jgi:hypothetical protein
MGSPLTIASYVLVGFVVGTCTAFSGVGAGALMTPMLVLVMGVDAKVAIGSDLLFNLGTKIVAVFTHMRRKTIQPKLLLWLCVGGIPGAIAGVIASVWLRDHLDIHALERFLRVLLGLALLASSISIAFGKGLVTDISRMQEAEVLPRGRLVVIGVFVGLLVSLTSIGSGSLTLPLLLIALPGVAIVALVGTDIAFSVALLIPSLFGHWRIGDVNAVLSAWLLVGSVPGVILGTYLATRLHPKWFRTGLTIILGIVAVRLLIP